MNGVLDGGLFLALTLFAVVSSITPGPNNTMMLASGVRFGLRRPQPRPMAQHAPWGFGPPQRFSGSTPKPGSWP
jgi:hypothetical protein